MQQEAARKLGFQREEDHDPRPASLRRHGPRRHGHARSDHLHAYRLRAHRAAALCKPCASTSRETYGKEYLPAEPNVYKSKKSAQDAHEAIRPTSLEFTPEKVQHFLDKDEFRLYQLIWNRFVASQMNPAVYDQTAVDIVANDKARHEQQLPRHRLRDQVPGLHRGLLRRQGRAGRQRRAKTTNARSSFRRIKEGDARRRTKL